MGSPTKSTSLPYDKYPPLLPKGRVESSQLFQSHLLQATVGDMELPLLTLSVMVALLFFPFSTSAGDPGMLQDICVADLNSEVRVNGFACKDMENVTEMDFWSDVIAKSGSTNNSMGSRVTNANVMRIPGLNTLGVSLARIDYAPGGLNPPHIHPRATEMAFVLEGRIFMAFITTSDRLISKVINTGETFVFPRGLVHFQSNIGNKSAVAIVGFDSQNPGTQSIPRTLFGSHPGVLDEVLAKAFQISTEEVKKIKSGFAPKM